MKASWREGGDQDGDLVQALRRAEPSAPGLLIDRHGTRIHRLAGRILDDPRDVEEVTQDVRVTIIREIQTFKGAAAFSSWIYRITANAALGKLRKTRRTRSEASLDRYLPTFDTEGQHAEPVSDWSGEPAGAAMAAELKRAIERGLRKLPADYRAVVLLPALPSEDARPGSFVRRSEMGGAVSAQRTHRIAWPRGLRQIDRQRFPAEAVNLVVGLDDDPLHAAGDPHLSVPGEGLLAHVRVEQDPAAELRALDRPHPPPVGPVRRILVVVPDGHDEGPSLGVHLASRHLDHIGLARPARCRGEEDTREPDQPAPCLHAVILAWLRRRRGR